jgi:hypothetical protein
MPSTQTKHQRRFREALKTYLASIDLSKKALGTAIQLPSRGSAKAYQLAYKDEKQARKQYRKVTRKLCSHIEKR